ncbi:peroxiredoxin [Lysobacter sp. TY2-98]|uniref:peroxiredoxin n=1 Tax=Lysobacter sp. TY2-98 TaxID=2290922 RepID=UPI000E207D7E|nr:peroxiredoxin [Lysobacter sp. TY2-98]AXK71967.1 peroxiredoxin [Lysobacter sp. TY2-98]
MAIDIGDTVPDLPLALSSDITRKLSDYRGHWLVLYFYPKDSTPGCTTEGIDFNSLLDQFKRADATVIGVSRDSVKSHKNFCAKQGFRFDLASDADSAICDAFDVIKPKKLYGRDYVGIERSTFLIDPKGRVAHVWRPVKVPGHADAVLAKLRELQVA